MNTDLSRSTANFRRCILCLCWLAAGTHGLSAQQGAAAEQQPEAEPIYVIQPDDILEIFVWNEEELTREVLVRPDGRISLPLVQDLMAAGTTPPELKRLIEARLSEFIEAPNVTVIVDTIQHYKIYVTGKVQNPGSFTLPRAVSVLQALSLAGGFQDFANRGDISIVQEVKLPGGQTEIVVRRFNYGEVINGKKLHQNITLRSGDVVAVP